MPNATQTDVLKADRKFQKPVSWLLGRQLIASLKSTLLYTAFGSKIDARDWMDAKVFPPAQKDVVDAWRTMYERDPETPEEVAAGGGKEVDFTSDAGEFWFDYISDTGDGMTASYTIAYLCLNDLYVSDPGTEMPAEKVHVRLPARDDVTGLKKLPRGEFLLVGGDTSYHMADYASLHMRFQLPFQWAYHDLRADLGKKPIKEMSEAERKKEIRRLRPLFGIPGNHDYYDMLDGFRRQFREPTRSRAESKYFADPSESSQLQLPGFRRYQETSYVALRLPFEWMLFGLDTEVGKLDERQRDFFTAVKAAHKPKNLIVCTSAPTTVFGKFADKDDEKSAKAFLQLDLPRPFLKSLNVEPTTAAAVKEKEQDEREKRLDDSEIRLDLAGDVHQYARYWGPASPNTQPTRHYSEPKEPLLRKNYASVISGLGGAFHHPSTTSVNEIREQALYPGEDTSRKHVAREIFNPWRVVKGGGVWFVGGLVALILAFAAIANDSTRPAIHNFKIFIALGITEPDRYGSTVSSPEEAKRDQGRVGTSVITKARNWLGYSSPTWSPKPMDNDCDEKLPIYLWGKCRTVWPNEYWWGFLLIMLTLPAMLVAIIVMYLNYRTWREREEVDIDARKPEQWATAAGFDNDAHVSKVRWAIWGFTVGTVLLAVFSVLLIMPYRKFITPFGNSLLVLLTMCWAAVAAYLSRKYSDWLFEQASMRQIRRRDWAIAWVLTACAVFALAIGLWVFGKNNVAAYLMADILAVLVAVAIPLLLVIAGVTKGGEHQGIVGKIGMGFVGFFHGVLQIGAAIFLIQKGTWLTFVLSVIVVLIFWWIGKTLMRQNWRGWLVFAWIVFGTVMLVLPPLVYNSLIDSQASSLMSLIFWPHSFDQHAPFARYEWWFSFEGWWQLIPIFLGGIFGAFLSCVWLGWYFGVCLSFHGHNNETGGAARIEKFKQMIRLRLTKNSLTGYVIAVDDPQREGKLLYPQIVDVFHLTSKG